jgi:hypothetical protein
MVTPQFTPGSAGIAQAQALAAIGETYSNIFARAEQVRQSRERLELDKQRTAAEIATTDLRTKMARIQYANAQNELLLSNTNLDIGLAEAEGKRTKIAQDAAARVTNEKLLAQLPEDIAQIRDLPAEDHEGIVRAWAGVAAKYGHLQDDPTFGARFRAEIAPAASYVKDRETMYATSVQAAAPRLYAGITLAKTPEALAQISSDPFFAAVLRSDPGTAKLFDARRKELEDEKVKSLDRQAEVEVAQAKGAAGKILTDTATKSLSQIQSAKDDLRRIKSAFDKIAESWRSGPIGGRIGAFTTAWNPDFQALTALITSAVPNLARGVFGEVGVLTDTDVDRYTKLLPNAKQDPEVAARLLSDLSEKLELGYKNFVDTYGKAGYNVSGFRDASNSGAAAQKTPEEVLRDYIRQRRERR